MSKRLLSIKEIIAEYGVTDWFWRTQIWERRLPAINLKGRKQLIDRADIELFISRNKS